MNAESFEKKRRPSQPLTEHNRAATETFFTEQELATRWGVSVAKLRKDRLLGGGCAWVSFGRAVRYSLSAIHKYEMDNRHQATAEYRLTEKAHDR